MNRFDDYDAINKFFNTAGVDVPKEVDISVWIQGGMFRPSFYTGPSKADVMSLTVEYNRSNKKLKLHWECDRQEGLDNLADYISSLI